MLILAGSHFFFRSDQGVWFKLELNFELSTRWDVDCDVEAVTVLWVDGSVINLCAPTRDFTIHYVLLMLSQHHTWG